MKISIKELKAVVNAPIELFICMASFETRCGSILSEIHEVCKRVIVLRNSQCGKLAEDNFERMLSIAREATGLTLDLDEPMSTARSLLSLIEHLDPRNSGSVFVDVTTFTHEQLLILFRIFSVLPIEREVIFGYTGADRYSTNTDKNEAWLSKGVSQVRSVLGFPGKLLPSRRLHLVLLVGFEHERAKAVIEAFEPSVLTLGLGQRDQSISPSHYESNCLFFEDVKKFVARRAVLGSSVRLFSFSCVDPQKACDAVLEEIKQVPGYNTVICPMNTKLSTLGAALAATESPDIQLCYSRAIEYNEHGYSTPSEQVTIFKISFDGQMA